MNRLQLKHKGFAYIGLALSLFFLSLTLNQANTTDLKSAFFSIRYEVLLGCAAFLAMGVYLRSIRWRNIAGSSAAAQKGFFRATTLGVFSNLIFPVRAGEFVRLFSLVKFADVPLPGSVASAMIDRLIDIIVLALSAMIVNAVLPSEMSLAVLTAMAIAFTALILIAAVYAKRTNLADALATKLLTQWIQRWPAVPRTFLVDFKSEMCRMLLECLNMKVAGIVVIIWLFDNAAIALLLAAFGLALPPQAPLVLWVFLTAGSTLPSAPGYVGIYQAATVWALSFYFVPASGAVVIASALKVTVIAVT